MTVVIDGTQYLPIAEAARKLATTPMRVLMLLKQRALDGELVEGDWYIAASSLACFDAHAARPALQAACRTTCSGSGCACR